MCIVTRIMASCGEKIGCLQFSDASRVPNLESRGKNPRSNSSGLYLAMTVFLGHLSLHFLMHCLKLL